LPGTWCTVSGVHANGVRSLDGLLIDVDAGYMHSARLLHELVRLACKHGRVVGDRRKFVGTLLGPERTRKCFAQYEEMIRALTASEPAERKLESGGSREVRVSVRSLRTAQWMRASL